jgi:CRP-like cAMP-binding protein
MSSAIHSLFDGGSTAAIAKDEALFDTGGRVRFMHFVVEGQVDLIRHSESGVRMVLFRAGPGQVPAEASAYSDTYHCDGIADRPSRLRSIPVRTFRARLDGDIALANAWAERLAHALQGARMNAEIRTLRTVAERIDAWQAGFRPLPPKGQWQNLAQVLGVSREALYRELANRRR